MIHSQETSFFQDKTEISYEKLNEFAKFVEYYYTSQVLIQELERQNEYLQAVLSEKQAILRRYDENIVPNLQKQISLLKTQINTLEEIYEIAQIQHKSELSNLKRKKTSLGLFVGANFDGTFVAGAGISYSLIRF